MLNNLLLNKVYNKGQTAFDIQPDNSGIVLVSTADKGPAMVPIKVQQNDLDRVATIFGPDSNITNNFVELKINNSKDSDVYIIRLNGVHNSVQIGQYLKLTTIEANTYYNDFENVITVAIDSNFIVFSISSLRIEKRYLISSLTYKSLADLINLDALTIGLPFFAELITDKVIEIQDNLTVVKINNDEDNELVRITEILEYLNSYKISQICIPCIDFDKVYNQQLEITQVGLESITVKNTYDLALESIIYFDEIPLELRWIDGNTLYFSNLIPAEKVVIRNYDTIYNILTNFCKEQSNNLCPCIVNIGITNSVDLTTRITNFANSIINKSIQPCEYINIPIMQYYSYYTNYSIDNNEENGYIGNGVSLVGALINSNTEYEVIGYKILNNYMIKDLLSFTPNIVKAINKFGFIVGNLENNVWTFESDYNNTILSLYENNGLMIYRNIPTLLNRISNILLIKDFLYNISTIYDYVGELNIESRIKKDIEDGAKALYPYIQKADISINKTYIGYTVSYNISITLYILGSIESMNISLGVS